MLFLLEEGVKKEEQRIQVIKTTTIGGEREREKKAPILNYDKIIFR